MSPPMARLRVRVRVRVRVSVRVRVRLRVRIRVRLMLRLRVGGHEPAERLALAEATQARDVRPEPRHEHGAAHV